MKPLALIPARAGSRRLPGKNLETIGGLTLIELAIVQAHLSECFDRPQNAPRIVVCTDYALNTWASGTAPVFAAPRPIELAGDDVPMMAVVHHVMNWAIETDDMLDLADFDSVVLLQPTSPLRLPADIQTAVHMLESWEAVISVVESPAPEVFTIGHADRLRPINVSELADGRRLAVPNGAIFAARRDVLEGGKDWWTASLVRALLMPPERSVDIDTVVDLERAREAWENANVRD